MKQHGLLAPSDSNTWYQCTGKPALTKLLASKNLVFETSNSLADRGNLLHEVAAANLRGATHPEVLCEEDQASVDTYVNYVKGMMAAEDGRKSLFVEHRVSFAGYTGFLEHSFGTADAIIINYDTKIIDVIDYKSGRVFIDAYENSQMKIYGVGAYLFFSLVCEIKKIRLTIVQPMVHNIRSVTYTVDEILDFAGTLRPKAEAVVKQIDMLDAGVKQEDFDLVSGSHCLYCPCAPFCKKFNAATLGALVENNIVISEALANIEAAPQPTEQMLANALDIMPMVKQWCANVELTAEKFLLEKRNIPGYLISKRRQGNRYWADWIRVVEKLKEYGYDEDEIFTPMVIKSVSQIEKLMAKDKESWAQMQEYIGRHEGKDYWKKDEECEPYLLEETELQFENLTGGI